MSPSERLEKHRMKESVKTALTPTEEDRLNEGEHIRREMPIGERGHLKRMLRFLLERERESSNK